MKTRRTSRVLALALCLVLALSLVSGLTLRSEAEPAPVPEPASMETPEPEASEEPEATAEPTAEASEEPEPTEEPTPGPTEGEVDDETAEPSDAPEATEEPEVTEEPTDEPVEPTEEPTESTDAPAAQEYACQSEGGVTVSASADPASGIPVDAALHADEVAAGTEAYAKAYAAVWAQLGLGEGDELYILPFDVYFTDAAGGKIEPDSGLVQVTMTFATDPFAAVLAPAGTVGDPGVAEGPSFDGEMQPAPEMVTERLAVHILDDGAVETLTAETAEEGAVTFAVGSFSVMGPALVRRSAPAPMAADQTAVYVPALPEGVEGASADTIEAAAALLAAEGGAIYLTGDVTMDTVAFDGKAVTVQSYGEGAAYTVTKNGTGENMFVLTNGAALTLANVTVNAANNVGGRTVTASGGAKLVLDAGAALTGNTAYGAVYLDGASIEIAGGVIRDNAAAGTASTKTWAPAPPNWTKDTVRYAYDVDLGEGQGLGGAILMVNGSAFAISSGEVSGNSALCGGAIYAWGGSSIKLSGGSVSNNTATGVDHTASGGAIAVDGGACAFTVNGAEIAGNSATQGGAFWFGIDTGKLDFTMTSGTIHGNSATDGSVAYFLGADSLIDISGSGSVIKGNTASGNGAFYVGKYPGNASSERAHFTVRDGATFSENKAAKGSCMYLTRDKGVNGLTLDGAVFTNNETTSDGGVLRYGVPESTFTVRNSTFTGNRTETNGGCFYVATDAQNSTFVFDGSVFKDNYAKNQGGVWRGFPPQSEFLFKDCTFTDNTAENGDGGCFYFPGDGPSSNITIDGGTFTGNKSGSSGGAFRANLNGGTVTVKGNATFKGNSADVNAGAFSIRRKGAGYYGEAYLLSCTVDGNWCNADFSRYTADDLEPTKHYNTGGVYIGENITCYMYDALVTGNSVLGGYEGATVGSGIGLCPNAQVFLYPEHGATIYGNGDGDTMDILAVPYDPAINHETPAKLYVSSTTPDGHAYNWTDLTGGEARTGGYDWTNARSGIATVSALDDGYHSETTLTPVGFKAHIGNAGFMTADAEDDYSVRIINNFTKSAYYAGGGMMVNGKVIAGNFKVNVVKNVVVKGTPSSDKEAEIYETEFKFRFSIIDTGAEAGKSDLKAPKSAINYTYTTGTGKNGTLEFKKGQVTYEETVRDCIYCDFSVFGSDTVNIGEIKKEDIGITDDEHYYRFLLEETYSGGANSVVITSENTEYGSSFGSGSVTEFKFTVTNTFEFGELDLTKKLAGPSADQDRLWTFHVELKNGEEALSGPYPVELHVDGKKAEGTITQGALTFTGGTTTLTFNDGKADVQLKGGQTLKIKNLPVGVDYTVTEDTADNYTTEPAEKATGKTSTTASNVTFTNTRKTGDLAITKTVAGSGGDTTKAWKFDITLMDGETPVNGEFTVEGTPAEGEGSSVSGGKITFAGGKATVYLTHGQTITITGLPVGTTYTVTEADDGKTPYETTKENENGGIKADKKAEAKFTNTAQAGSLTITKTLAGNGTEADKEWHFTVKLTPPAGFELAAQYSYTGTNGVVPGTLKFTKSGDEYISDEFTLKGGQSLTITGLPVGTEYDVDEEESGTNGYNTTATDTGTIEKDAEAKAEFTNTRYAGDLAITKTVEGNGGDKTKAWTFTITLTPKPTVTLNAHYDYEITGVEPSRGQVDVDPDTGAVTIGGGKVALKDGQTITIKGLPVETSYTVTEDEANIGGYTTTSSGDEGSITRETTAQATFTNARYIGDLKISKTVAGSGGDQNKAWKFTITLKNGEAPVSGTYAYEGDVTAGDDDSVDGSNITFDANGTATVYLKHGQSITIKGVLAGTTYTVAEEEAAKNGYTTEAVGSTGDIKETPTAEAAFTNTRYIGSLAVSKTVGGELGDPNKDWHFAITLKAPAGETLAAQYDYAITGGTASNGKVAVGADGKVTLNGNNVTLKHGQTITITGLPVGTTYTVTEDEADKDDYGTAVNGANGAIEKDKTAQVQFTNTKPAPKTGDLTVSKTVAGSGDKSKEFTFTVTLTPPEGKTIVDMSDTYPVEGPGTATGELKFAPSADGKAYVSDPFKLKDGESLTVKGILAGSGYTVTEEEADKDGYTTEAAGASGAIPADSAVEAKFTNTKPTPDETPKPSATPPAAPETGDNGRPGLWLALTVLTALGAIAAGAALAVRRRRFGSGK